MSSPHAMIIDDNATNLKILSQLLSMQGVTNTALQDATKIGEALKGLDRLDVIFLDLEMPRIDGYRVLGILRDDLGITVPIVACTVHTGEITTARDLGFHSFLGKPLHADKF